MGRFDGILICTDLDGTLYKNDKTVSEENRRAIAHFKAEGGSFTFITGRMPYYAGGAYRVAKPNVAFGCINGGGLYDGEVGQYLWNMELPRRALALAACIDERVEGVGIQICGFDKTYFAKDNETTARFRRETGVPHVTCDICAFDAPMGKLIFCTDDEEKIGTVARTLTAHERAAEFDFIRSDKSLFEVLPKGACKGLALKKLAEQLGIASSRTIAVGDYDNDVSMLRAAGWGIAVGNASPAALAAARHVTVSNEEHAIAQVVSDLEQGRFGI